MEDETDQWIAVMVIVVLAVLLIIAGAVWMHGDEEEGDPCPPTNMRVKGDGDDVQEMRA